MQSAQTVTVKKLLLVGGGHSHAIFLRMLAMKPILGLDVTLVSNVSHAAYSGMIPAFLAGRCSYDSCHIDLRRLCELAKCRFVQADVAGLNLDEQVVECAGRVPLGYDILSLNAGSHPGLEVPGSKDYVLPVKPLPAFLQKWEDIVAGVVEKPYEPVSIVVVGGGAGGVEISFAIRARLDALCKGSVEVHLVESGAEILRTHNSRVRKTVTSLLRDRGVSLHLGSEVTSVQSDGVVLKNGANVFAKTIMWVTGARVPKWVKDSGLATTPEGFISTTLELASVSHGGIFAAGDIAEIKGFPREKAGVYAVRQGPVLFRNLQCYFEKKSLTTYQPQKRFLSIIGTGGPAAIASYSRFCFYSLLVYKWKDWIDRRFMASFHKLQPNQFGIEISEKIEPDPQPLSLLAESKIRCQGCGSKVGGDILLNVLLRLKQDQDGGAGSDKILVSESPEDAQFLPELKKGRWLQSLDYFPSPLSDLYTFGQVAVNHCFSDIYAMGGEAHSIQVLALLPFAASLSMEEDLYQMLAGVISGLRAADAKLLGGHTAENDKYGLGLLGNGILEGRAWYKKGLRVGDVLIVTKPIGIGTILAGAMQARSSGRFVDHAIEVMLQSNRRAATIMADFDVSACTDITGFGLLGHLKEMLVASGKGVNLDLDAVVVLPGALNLMEKGVVSSLFSKNILAADIVKNFSKYEKNAKLQLLADPQTSGGLLFGVAEKEADLVLEKLKVAGYSSATACGRVIAEECIFIK